MDDSTRARMVRFLKELRRGKPCDDCKQNREGLCPHHWLLAESLVQEAERRVA